MKTVKPLLFAFALTAAGAATITAGPPDRHDFERPGVTADRARREVAIAATATGLGRNELVEFVLIHDASGHDYEALATTVAKPSDVDAALRAIGLKRGRPVRHDQLAFWPKGERLAVSVGSPPGGSWSNAVPAESLIWNGATDQPMGAAGFVFTGSLDIRDPDGGAMVYAADIAAPHAIIPLYNETAAVLDVPRRSPQGATYGSQSVNAALQLPKGTPLTFTLRPLRMVGSSQMEATLTIAAGSQAPADGGPAVTMTLVSEDAGSLAHGSQFTALRTALEAIVRDGRDPFLSIHIDPQLSVDNIRACCQFLESLEDELGVRIEPPEPRHLYYK
ncbi:MAG: YdjY domain-containing protein, partial [Verrucomicrobia bacterium]|nr:YdjY domain-containing protein [Verrucomicrobiota bacterium]